MILFKVTVAFALALAVAALARRAASATRHAVLAAGQLVALLVPLLIAATPAVWVEGRVVSRVARAAPRASATLPPAARRVDLSLLWIAGTVLIAASRTLSYLRAANVVRRAKRFGEVLLSDEVDQPVTLGTHIVLPRCAEAWDEARLRAVLLHERAHVARRDSLLALLSDAATAVYWFHPLAWLVARRAMLERERACDEAVLAGGVARADYAEALVAVARAVRARPVRGLAIADRSQLRTRVVSILEATMRRPTITARILVILAALVAAPLLAALTPRGIEPDLLGDALASPLAERIVVDDIPDVPATGPDAALIAELQRGARHESTGETDFVAFRSRWALAQVRNGELVGPLIEATRDGDWRIRAYAAWALAVARDARATAALVELMADGNWRVRAAGANALAEIGDARASEAMRAALGDEAWQVRSEAVRYFAAIGADRGLFERMARDRHLAVRSAAREALR